MSKYVEAANWISEQRQAKKPFQNFNEIFDLESFEDAYLVQDELETIWAHKGQVTGYLMLQNIFNMAVTRRLLLVSGT